MATLASVLCVLTFLVLAFITQAASQSPNCRTGWKEFNGVCYGYSKANVSFGDALAICKAYGAKLVEIETKEENDFVTGLAAALGETQIWIGGSDQFSEGEWEWLHSGQRINETYEDWDVGEPNDYGNNEACLQLLLVDGVYKWNDNSCTWGNTFICEEPEQGTIVG